MNLMLLPNYKYIAIILYKHTFCFQIGEIFHLICETKQVVFNSEMCGIIQKYFIMMCYKKVQLLVSSLPQLVLLTFETLG